MIELKTKTYTWSTSQMGNIVREGLFKKKMLDKKDASVISFKIDKNSIKFEALLKLRTCNVDSYSESIFGTSTFILSEQELSILIEDYLDGKGENLKSKNYTIDYNFDNKEPDVLSKVILTIEEKINYEKE